MKTQKATITRLQTGVPGLDAVLGGGLPEFSFNLIAGSPGTGKTTLAHQIMFALATAERPALYFTVLGEPPLKILRYQQQFDFFDLDHLNRSIRFINLAEVIAAGDLDAVLARIVAEVAARGPSLVFVDSFCSVVMASEHQGKSVTSLQQFVQNLGVQMASWQATIASSSVFGFNPSIKAMKPLIRSSSTDPSDNRDAVKSRLNSTDAKAVPCVPNAS